MEQVLPRTKPVGDSCRVALAAFHEGVIDSGELRRAVRVWLEDSDQNLCTILKEHGGFDTEEFETIEQKLIDYYPAHLRDLRLDFSSRPEEFASDRTGLSFVDEGAEDVSQHSSKSGGGKGRRSKRSSNSNYYDSVHDQFTRDERPLKSVSRTVRGFRRRTYQDFRRFLMTCASLGDISYQWLRFNYKYAIFAISGIVLAVPAVFALAAVLKSGAGAAAGPRFAVSQDGLTSLDELSRSDVEAASLTDAPVDMPEVDSSDLLGDAARVMAANSPASSMPPVGLEDVTAVPALVLSTGGEADLAANKQARTTPSPPAGPDNAVSFQPASARVGDTAAVEIVSAVVEDAEADSATAVGDPAVGEPNMSSRVQLASSATGAERDSKVSAVRRPVRAAKDPMQYLGIGGQLIAKQQFGRASVLLASALNEFPDSDDMRRMLATAYLANGDYSAASDILLEDDFADAENDIWVMLFTSWLLHAPEDDREQGLAHLNNITSSRKPTDILRRCTGWIAARNKNVESADEILATPPLFSPRSFADAFFFSVTMRYSGNDVEARKQLKYAVAEFKKLTQNQQFSSDDRSGAALAARLTRLRIEKAINQFARSLTDSER